LAWGLQGLRGVQMKRKTGISSSSDYCPNQQKNIFSSETGLIEVEL